MERGKIRKYTTIVVLGFIGWALCGASMGIGLALSTEEIALILHAIAAPIIFAGISIFYFSRYNYTTPLQTAAIFVSIIIFLDIFVVAMMIEKSFDMFRSLLGTWIPFALIFTSTYVTGTYEISRGRGRMQKGVQKA